MPFTNLRNAYGFDPQDYDYQSAGGLPGLLRDAMLRQGLQQGSQGSAIASSAPNPYSDNYGNPQGLFGRLLALQTNQGFPIGIGQGNATSGVASLATPVQFSIPFRPGPPLPFPPTDPKDVPQIPMPPEPWPTIGKVLWSGLTRHPYPGHGPDRQEEDTSTSTLGPQPVAPTATPLIAEPWSAFGKVIQALPGLARGLIKGDDGDCPNCQGEDASTDGAGKTPGKPGAPPKSPLPIPPFSPKSNKSSGSSGGHGGGGGRRNRRDDDDSQCYERENQELANCNKRLEEYPHWDFFDACKTRASIRRDLCVRNKGNLNHDGPKEWGPDGEGDDEEIWYNGSLWR